MSSDSKTSFELEPNPFERSFANKETSGSDNSSVQGPKDSSTTTSSASSFKASNKHNLHIPNISNLNQQQAHNKLPGITPPLFTPSGRRLPPLGLSPGNLSNPDTPGTNLWNSLISATNNTRNTQSPHTNQQAPIDPSLAPQDQEHGAAPPYPTTQSHSFNQFVNTMRKTGLTPNESNIRSGLTPGAINHSSFPFSGSVPGLTTPGALLNAPMTPGLSGLLGISSSNNVNQLSHLQQYSKPPAPEHAPDRNQSDQPPPPPTQQQPQQELPQPPAPPQPQQAQQQNHITHQNIQPASQATATQPAPIIPQYPEDHSYLQQSNSNNRNNASASREYGMTQIREEERESPNLKRSADASAKETKKQKTTTKAKKAGKKEITRVKPDPEEQQGKFSSTSPSDSSPASNGSSTKNSQGPKSEEDKRKSFLERNRVAASKCRQRKKQLVQKMEDELNFYSTGYREMSAQVAQLRDQVITLKGILVSHKDCSMLAQSVGGYEALNNIIQQANYSTQTTANSNNVTSIPSTIPTTLNNTADSSRRQNGYPPPAPTSSVGPGLPVHMNNAGELHPNTNNSTNESSVHMPHATINYNNTQNIGAEIPSHHSISDLPASLMAHNSELVNPNYTNDNLRTIHSMSNLQAMNQVQRKSVPGVESNLRPVNSMIDLQSHQYQSQNMPSNFNLISQSQE